MLGSPSIRRASTVSPSRSRSTPRSASGSTTSRSPTISASPEEHSPPVSLYTKVRTSLGTLAIGFGGRGVSRVLLPRADWNDLRAVDLAAAELRTEIQPPRAIARVATLLRSHIAGDVRDFSGVVLDTADSPPFALRVQRAAQAIPAGETRSYGELATLAGSPGAARAVGSAMASNPWPIIVPCHRVFARSGFGEY